MSQNVHGHKILDILSEQSLSRDELKSLVLQKFGADVQFHTCKSEGLDFDTLFDFFIKMQKVTCTEGKYSHQSDSKCNH